MLRNQQYFVCVCVYYIYEGLWEDSFVADACWYYYHAHKGFHQPFASNKLKILYFSIAYRVFEPILRGPLFAQCLFTWYSIVSISLLFREFNYLHPTLFARISFRQHESIFSAKAWKDLAMLLHWCNCFNTVCFYLFVIMDVNKSGVHVVRACVWFGASLKNSLFLNYIDTLSNLPLI